MKRGFLGAGGSDGQGSPYHPPGFSIRAFPRFPGSSIRAYSSLEGRASHARGDSVEIPTGFYALRRSRRPVLPLSMKKSSQQDGQIDNRGVVFQPIYISKTPPEIRGSRRVPLSIEGMDPQGFGSFLDAPRTRFYRGVTRSRTSPEILTTRRAS